MGVYQTHHPFALLDIDLVADNDLPKSVPCLPNLDISTYEWEALRVHGASLHQKLVPPAVQCIETLRVVHVVHEHAAVGAAVEGNAQRLEALLAGRIPELTHVSRSCTRGRGVRTCIVTSLSSTSTSLVRKSAPIVAL
jgi:hypothetical protein